jgi:hypothetical protein
LPPPVPPVFPAPCAVRLPIVPAPIYGFNWLKSGKLEVIKIPPPAVLSVEKGTKAELTSPGAPIVVPGVVALPLKLKVKPPGPLTVRKTVPVEPV